MFGEKLFYRVMNSLSESEKIKAQREVVVKSAHLSESLSETVIKAKRNYHAKRAMRPFSTKKSIIENTIQASACDRALKMKGV